MLVAETSDRIVRKTAETQRRGEDGIEGKMKKVPLLSKRERRTPSGERGQAGLGRRSQAIATDQKVEGHRWQVS